MEKDKPDRREYMRKYNAARKETQAAYYRGYNANRHNKLRRHNRYLKDLKIKALEQEIKRLNGQAR